VNLDLPVSVFFYIADYLSMGCNYYAAGGCIASTLMPAEIFKMASKMAAATPFNSIPWQLHALQL